MLLAYLLTLFLFLVYLDAVPISARHDQFLKYFLQGQCTLPKAVVIPAFEPTTADKDDGLNGLLKSLDSCRQSDPYPICEEIYGVLRGLSTCSTEAFNKIQKPIAVKIQSNVCSDFKGTDSFHLNTARFVSPYLRNRLMCETVCAGKYATACKVLLWSYQVQQQLRSLLKGAFFVNPFDDFRHRINNNNCLFHKAIIVPKFPLSVHSSDLLKTLIIPLKPCDHVAAYETTDALCEAVFRILYSLTDCDSQLHGREKKYKVEKQIHAAVCNGFKNSKISLSEDVSDISYYLKNEQFCDIVCTPEVLSVCQTLLWAYEVRNSIYSEDESTLSQQDDAVGDKIEHSKASSMSGTSIEDSVTSEKYSEKKSENGVMPNTETVRENNSNELSEIGNGLAESNGVSEDIVSHTDETESKVIDIADELHNTPSLHPVPDVNQVSRNKNLEDPDINQVSNKKDQVSSNKYLEAPHVNHVSSTKDLEGITSDMSKVVAAPNRLNKNVLQNTTASADVTKIYEHDQQENNGRETHVLEGQKLVSLGTFTRTDKHTEKESSIPALAVKPPVTVLYETDTVPSTTIVSTSTVVKFFFSGNEDNESGIADLGRSATMNHIKPAKDIPEFDGSSNYDSSVGMNDQKAFEPSYKQFDKSMQEQFIEQENSHFFLYLLCILALVAGCYLVIHNKQKVIALIVEGRHERRRRPHSAGYKKLDMK